MALKSGTRLGPYEVDLETGLLSYLTDSPRVDIFAVWAPSSDEIFFGSDRAGPFSLWRQPTALGAAELLLETDVKALPMDVTSDGRLLLYRPLDPSNGGYDLWMVPTDGTGEATPVVATPATEREGQFSPDDTWLAYQSDADRLFEIYLQPFPGPGRPRRVSPNGGVQVRWRDDGRELFYVDLEGWLVAVPVTWTDDEPEPGRPVPLFRTMIGEVVPGYRRQQYAVSSDGERFLMSVVPDGAEAPPISVLLNWRPGD